MKTIINLAGVSRGVLAVLCVAGALAPTAANAASTGIYATYEVKSEHASRLAFGAPGIVEKLTADLGDSVQKGQILAELDASVERARIDAAAAAERLAASSLARAKAARGALSQAALDEAIAASQNASAQLALARASLELKRLRAPFSGRIAARFVQLGDGAAGPAQPAFELVSTERVLLEISFDVSAANAVKIGDEFCFAGAVGAGGSGAGARLAGATGSGAKLAGAAPNGEICARISRISPVASLRSKKIIAQALMPASTAGAPVPGTFGEGVIKHTR